MGYQVDVSGSMEGDPMGVSIGIGILGCSLPNNSYRNRLLTFESLPNWIKLEYPVSHYEFTYLYPGQKSRSYPLGKFNLSKVNKELDWIEKIAIVCGSSWGGNTNFVS